MKRFQFPALFFFIALFLAACGDDDAAVKSDSKFNVSLRLPIDYNNTCEEYNPEEGKNDPLYYNQFANCLTGDDEVVVSVYSKNSTYGEYSHIEDRTVELKNFSFSLQLQSKAAYNQIFVTVLNKNGKIKLTGGVESIRPNIDKTITVFLVPAGDFARIVTDKNNPGTDFGSLRSYFDDSGSKGSAAAALKNGNIFMAGGFDIEEETVTPKATIFDMKTLSAKAVKNLHVPLYDHVTALLDDMSESGSVVVGFGTNGTKLSSRVWAYNPKSDKYDPIVVRSPGMTKARAITIDGEVYIVGGCSESKAETAVYRIHMDKSAVVAEKFADLNQGRCNHAIADVSTVSKTGRVTPRILVIGGSTNYTPEGRETPVTGENFAEIVTNGASSTIEITDRSGGDTAELKTTGLISPAATALVMDDKETAEKVVSVAGGYISINDAEDDKRVANPNLFVFSEKDGKLVYDTNNSPFKCVRPSMAALGTWKNDLFAYAALNCGTKELDKDRELSDIQTFFVVQVKRSEDYDGNEVFASSVRESLMENRDPDSDAKIISGPAVADTMGQVFLLGGQYVYRAGSYAVPGSLHTGTADTRPPKPIIHVAFEYPIQKPMSYRNIYDQVQMNLKDTCVALKDDPNTCDPEWVNKYYIRYKWEMTESPTPLLNDSKLRLTESSSDSAGQWIPDDGVRDNPKRAAFTGLMITPRRYDDQPNEQYNAEECAKCGDEPSDPNNEDKYFFKTLSNYLLCRQKYCEETRTKYYKINIQAEAVDRTTDLVSDTADITVVPKIIPQARVVAQLTWKQGFKTKAESESKEGAAIDIDIHMIKKESLEAPQYSFTPTEGLLGTSYRSEETEAACPYTMPECEKYWRHDDCSFSDQGVTGVEEGRTIQWHASLDIDNTWGGNNYETPETIGLGPIIDKDPEDGVPDTPIIDDQYLLVVGYVGCTWKTNDNKEIPDSENRCLASYTGEDGVYEVDARVEILIDGVEAPRKAGSDRPADSYASKNFKIKVNEWKTIALVKWDNSWKGPETNQKYTGNALVTDVAMADQEIALNAQTHPVCTYNMSDAVLLPIWNANEYVKRVTEVDENGGRIGTCGAVDPNTNPGGDEGGETTPDEDNGEGEDDSDEETDDSDNE